MCSIYDGGDGSMAFSSVRVHFAALAPVSYDDVYSIEHVNGWIRIWLDANNDDLISPGTVRKIEVRI